MSRLLGEIGTVEWCRRTDGILGRGERARFVAATVLQSARVAPRMLLGRGGSGAGPDPGRLTPPDTPFARELVEACAELDPMLVEHGYRSYLFGRALGEAEGVECDEEALFSATMLHDWAFMDMDELDGECFAWAGAKAAEQILASSPLSESERHDVLDAICLHLNPAVPPAQGPVQHLAHDGIAVDVLGMRAGELDREGVRRAFERHPRHGFTARGEKLMRSHGKRVPRCRSAALFSASAGQVLRSSPWRRMDGEG